MASRLKRAKEIGGRKAAGAFLFAFLLFEAFALFIETNGDFANGLMAFFKAQADSFFLSLMLVMFITIFLFARLAGKKILLDGKQHVFIGLGYAFFTIAIVLVYTFGFVYVQEIEMDHWPAFIIFLSIFILLIWIWTAWRIKCAGA